VGEIADGFADTFRDYTIGNLPSAGAYEPKKSEIRALALPIEAGIAAAALSGTDLNQAMTLVAPLLVTAQRARTAAERAASDVTRVVNAIPAQVKAQLDGAAAKAVVTATAEAKGYAQDARRYLFAFPDYYQGSPGGDAGQFGLFTVIPTMNFAAGINRIQSTGFASRGDGGEFAYTRWSEPLDPLPTEGEGVWWNRGLDGSIWQIAPADEHPAQAFGALGDPEVDTAPIFNAALSAPQVRRINIGPLTHLFTPQITVPSGKALRGVNRSVSWMKVMPLPVGQTQTGPRFAIVHQDDTGGLSEDYSLDCQRSGLGRGDTNRTHGLCIIATNEGRCEGTRIRRVDVHNVWGYAQYTVAAALSNAEIVDIAHEDCRAINCQVGFETTGNIDASWSRDTYAFGGAMDGGTVIPNEALYHEYGAIKSFDRYNATGRGTAGAGILVFTTDGVDLGRVKYHNPDVVPNVGTGTALFVEGRDGNRVQQFEIEGGDVISSAQGALVRNAGMVIRGTNIVGLNGNGLEIGTGGDVDLHAPTVEANRDASGTTAAVGIVVDGTGTRRWYGSGRIAANGPAGSYSVNKSLLTFFGDPEFDPFGDPIPPQPGSVVRQRMFRIPRADWITNGTQDLQVRIDLTAAQEDRVADIDKAHLIPTLEFPFPNGGVNNPTVTFSTLWIDPTQVRVYVKCDQPLTGWVLKAQLTEYA
jgi:hypothetical protein